MSVPTTFACCELRFRDFRNFAALDLRLPPQGIAIVGDNGSGKTNFLEGIYYLEIFRSFRGAADEQLVRFGADAFHVRGRFERAGDATPHEVTAAFERRSHRKKVTEAGVEPERLSDAIGRVGAVVFSPSDAAIIAGPPGERRRFLDIVLSLNRAGYMAALQRYRQVLRQRNAMLREGASPTLLAAWDDSLVGAGARIVAERATWIAANAEGFARRTARIAGEGAPLHVRYEPAVPLAPERAGDAADVAEAFRAELRRTASRERERGVTLAGPHRDDVAFSLGAGEGAVDLRGYGSGGQQRTAALALRMVEAETVREARGGEPIVLLDDVFAELDPGRSRRILELLEEEERGQVILTAPKPSDLEVRHGTLPRLRIEAGRIHE